jgi:DNA-directed RNA polymerase subunit N (RpoN/RPB10)
MAMTYRPLCFTCGTEIGSVAHAFNAEKAKRMLAYTAKTFKTGTPTAEQISLAEGEVKMGDYLDELKITHICCRTRLLTQVRFSDVLGVFTEQ